MTYDLMVAGTQFIDPSLNMPRFMNASGLQTGDSVILKLEPNNPVDKFAVAVLNKNFLIGYIPKNENLEIAYYLDHPDKYDVQTFVKKKDDSRDMLVLLIDVLAKNETAEKVEISILRDWMNSLRKPQSQNTAVPQNVGSTKKGTSGCVIALYVVISVLIGLVLLGLLVNTCASNMETSKGSDSIAINVDSTAVSTNTKTIEKKKKDSATIAKLKPLFRVEKDEFQDISWVHGKNEPPYRNSNGFYCYFAEDDNGNVSNFRFVGQYAAEDWIFFKKLTFNIDGKNIDFYPQNLNSDHDTTIWEWYDDQVDATTFLTLYAISKAKTVKVRFHGQQYYDDKVMSEKSKSNIKNALEYYVARGGKIE